MPRIIRAFIILCAIFLALPAFAQQYQGRRLVEASLIADTDAIVPGKPFTVGLLLKMVPGWHTYWRYSGDAGLSTRIDWQLPPGFQAGEIQWPLPEKQTEEGDLQTYVYKDEVLLLVEIRPPATLDAKQITLPAKTSWLVCEKLCIPGHADLSLDLPVAAQNNPANAALFEKYRAQLPKTGKPPFPYKWSSQPGRAILDITGMDLLNAPAPLLTGLTAKPPSTTIDFFPLPAPGMVIDHPQVEKRKITVPITNGSPDQLAGVIAFSNGKVREGWYIPSQKSPPPTPAPASGSSTATPATQPTGSLFSYLVLGFLGGMLLNVMPCVLPVITLKIYGFINQAGQSRARILELGLAYCAGIFAWFLGLAALIVGFGLNWSFQFQNKGFIAALLVICVIFGLNLLGAFEVLLPAGLNSKVVALASKEGLGGAFVHGLFTTLMGSACTAPLLGPAIGFALAQTPIVIFAFFATIAAGMAFPYFILTVNPSWMRFLPRPGMWMVRIKQVMGVLVLATAFWFGYILYQQVAVTRDAFAPMLKTALASGRTVFVDFTAEWCINCKVNEKGVLRSDTVQQAFKDDNVLLLKADWTNGDPDITKLLKQFGRAGVPAYVIYPAGAHDQPMVLPELLTRQIVLDNLNTAQKKTSKNQ
ncbi:MAG: protein-disulfide reductase DsbD domain-containing protein [Chthoniobacteraceae bacterium]